MIKPERSPDKSIEFLDRRPWLSIVVLVLLPFAIHLPLWLLGRSTDPIWFFSGLNHGSHPLRWPFLDPNVGFTSEALGRLAAWNWLHGVVPWWNAYTGIGMPLAGELQPGAFFLPFNLLLLLPEGILWQQIAMQIIAGLSTYALLRELELSRLAALAGGALFALSGTIAWTPGPASVYCSLPFLPLLLFGVERARKQQRGAASILIIGVATAWSILAGFPEPAYISGLLVLAWGIYRLVSEPKRWTMAWRAIAGWLLGMLIASPLLIAFVDYVRQSDSFGIHNLGEKSLPWAAFSTTLMPYVYGSLGTSLHSMPLSRIWDNVGGYTSVLVILMAVVGVTGKSAHRGLKLLLLVWILLAWAKTFGVQPVTGLMNHIPLMRQANFFRYAPPSWSLALTILAAFGLDDFRNNTPGRRSAFGITIGLLVIAIALAWPQRAFWERPQAFVPLMFLLLGLSLAWALAGLLAAALSWKLLHGGRRRIVLACLLVVDAAMMFMVPQTTAIRGNQIDLPAVQFLSDHQGLTRSYTLGPMEPNYGAYFRVANIDHNVVPVPKLWANYVEHNLLPSSSRLDSSLPFYSSMTFWPGVMPDGDAQQDLNDNLDNYLSLGVRYVITKPGQSPTPIRFLPTADANIQQGVSGTQFSTPRLGMVLAALERCRSIANDPIKPAIERLMAKIILRVGHSIAGGSAQERIPANAESVAPSDTKYITLQAGQSASVGVAAPFPAIVDSPITSVGAILGNSGGAADGILTVEICVGSICRSGQRPLAESTDGAVFQIPLDQPLARSSGAPLRLTFTHQNGSRPVGLRLTPAGAAPEQQIQGPNGPLPGHTIQLAFEYGVPGLRKVYSDSVMDIWELPNPAPYFQVIQGGPCTLSTEQREDVTAECAAPATLLRRELYMPGWRVKVNDTPATSVQQDGLFQSAALPAGRGQVRYHFAPPYVEFGWAASLIGMAGLLWQVVLIGRSRQQRL
jgi:dolichol kinase